MSKEELLKRLIAEIDLIMHDKDYRFENQDGTWYSRESCRDLTNEEVFEELKGELRQLADLEAKLADSENKQLLDEKEWQDYCAFKHIEPQIKGCLDREKELKQQLAMQENTITNLIEDNRASQEWYKKQIADTEAQNKRVLEKLDLIVRSNQELELALSLAIKTLHKSQGSYCDYCEDANKRICSPLISNCHRHIVNYFKKQAQNELKEKK